APPVLLSTSAHSTRTFCPSFTLFRSLPVFIDQPVSHLRPNGTDPFDSLLPGIFSPHVFLGINVPLKRVRIVGAFYMPHPAGVTDCHMDHPIFIMPVVFNADRQPIRSAVASVNRHAPDGIVPHQLYTRQQLARYALRRYCAQLYESLTHKPSPPFCPAYCQANGKMPTCKSVSSRGLFRSWYRPRRRFFLHK